MKKDSWLRSGNLNGENDINPDGRRHRVNDVSSSELLKSLQMAARDPKSPKSNNVWKRLDVNLDGLTAAARVVFNCSCIPEFSSSTRCVKAKFKSLIGVVRLPITHVI